MGWMQFRHIKKSSDFLSVNTFPPNLEVYVSIQTVLFGGLFLASFGVKSKISFVSCNACREKVDTRVVYQFGIFGRYSVGISPVLPIPYRRKTRSVHFGIKKGAMPPFFLKRGAMAPFLRSPTPLLEKRGEKRGEIYK